MNTSIPYLSRFTPSTMTAEALEAIFVQRQELAKRVVELIRESILTAAKHHTLLVGPRGMGKTHFVSLVYHRLRAMDDVRDRLLVAWLREEEWGISSFLDLLLAILQAVLIEQPDDTLAERMEALYTLSPRDAERTAAAIVREYVGGRTLLLLMENLDDVFKGLGEEGQQQWRSYLQENPFSTILATSQSLFNGVSLQTSPFYGFFRIRHLKGLTLDDAAQLLANIARLRGDNTLAAFIQTPTGRDRIGAVAHLAGNNPRVYVIFSEFLTYASLDELVDPLMRTLDDLTPYYQSRMALLSPQQRKIVDLLCDCRHPITVGEIAQRCFTTHQTASSQLGKLREWQYVHDISVGRESYYEIHAPLMRLCAEVKKQRGAPIRLFVEFLRLWYSRVELQQRLETLRSDATVERDYLLQALEIADETEVRLPRNRYTAIMAAPDGATQDSGDILAALDQSIDSDSSDAEAWNSQGIALGNIGNYEGALAAHERATELAPEDPMLWYNRGVALADLGRHEEALAAFNRAIELDPDYVKAWNSQGIALGSLGRHEEALAAFNRAIELDPDYVKAWNSQGIALGSLGRHKEALAAFNRAIELDTRSAPPWHNRGIALENLERYEEALTSYERAFGLNGSDPAPQRKRAAVLMVLGRHEEALAAYDCVIELAPHDPTAWHNKGVTLSNLDRDEEALVAFDHAIELDPHALAIWNDRGISLGSLGRYEDALTAFDHAIEIDPEDAWAWSGRGMASWSLERYEEALRAYDTLIDKGIQVSSAYFGRAECLVALDQWDDGVAALEDALRRFAEANDSDNGAAEYILNYLIEDVDAFSSWRSRILKLIQIYDRHGALATLSQGIVRTIPTLVASTAGGTVAETWLNTWQELTTGQAALQLPLRLLTAAVRFSATGDQRTLLELSAEERAILYPLLDIEDLDTERQRDVQPSR